MRIYNGKNVQLDLPLGSQRIVIAPKSVSGDLMPNTEFLSLLCTSFDYNELALIVSGPYEINMCSSVSGSVGFVCQSLEEAVERFAPKCDCQKEEVEPCECKECTCSGAPHVEEVAMDEVVPETEVKEDEVEETEPEAKQKKGKVKSKK